RTPPPARRSGCIPISRGRCGPSISTLRQDVRNFNVAALTRRHYPGADYGQRGRGVFADYLRRPGAPNRLSELLELLGDGVLARERNLDRLFLAALEHPQALEHVVIRCGLLAVDVHQIVFRSRGIAGIERR